MSVDNIFVVFMRLNEAADLFRQVVAECPKLEGRNFLIMIPEPTEPVISQGYELIIRTSKSIDNYTDRTLRAIALEHGLKVLETATTIAMYTSTDGIG